MLTIIFCISENFSEVQKTFVQLVFQDKPGRPGSDAPGAPRSSICERPGDDDYIAAVDDRVKAQLFAMLRE
jgi:hypothetical protein